MDKDSTKIEISSIDLAGRVVIPKKIRENAAIEVNTPIAFYVTENEDIVITKLKPTCIFCGSKDDIIMFNSKPVCKECITLLNKLQNCSK